MPRIVRDIQLLVNDDDDHLYGYRLSDGTEVRIGSSRPENAAAVVGALRPSGWDQAAEIQQYFNDAGYSITAFDFGAGDFVLGSPITIYSRYKTDDGYGIGLRLKGAGPGATRLLDVRANKSLPLIYVTDPTGTTVNKRNYLAELSDFSLLSCNTSGVPLPDGTTDGVAFLTEAEVGTGFGAHVLHTSKFRRIYVDGFNTCFILDDATQPSFEQVWCREFVTGIYLGGNVDMLSLYNCQFGSEQFGSNYRNSASAIRNGYAGAIGSGGADSILIAHTWFMKIGAALDISTYNESWIKFFNSYFENCLQYVKTTGARTSRLVFDTCAFSLASTNDSSAAKIQLGTASESVVSMRNNVSTQAPAGGYISNEGLNSNFHFEGNSLVAGAQGHLRWAASGNERVITLPNNARGKFSFGGTYGITKTSGDERTVVKGTTGTITCDHWEADCFEIPALTGNITPSITGGAVPAVRGTRLRFRIQASATSANTRTITWQSNVLFPFSFAQPQAGDESKWTTVDVERTGSNWVVVSPQNIWVA